jgi:hypothetical protein
MNDHLIRIEGADVKAELRPAKNHYRLAVSPVRARPRRARVAPPLGLRPAWRCAFLKWHFINA